MLAVLVGCGGGGSTAVLGDEDSAAPPDGGTTAGPADSALGDSATTETADSAPVDGSCDVFELGFDGPEAPVVGESWTVWGICDGARVMGTWVVRVDPPDAATIAQDVVGFAKAGSVDVSVQAGQDTAIRSVVVGEAP